MVRGISLGIGITLGFIITILVVGFIIALLVTLYKRSLSKKFSAELFRLYRKELLEQEKFEEISDINKIIEQLKKNEKPNKEILQRYKVKVETYWYLAPTYDGGERLVFVNDKRIMRR